ncbi:MAG: DNA helicase RecQ [Bacteroidia bacterium]|nr:DNA helicase RecQ [Bacteroidia bacterium]
MVTEISIHKTLKEYFGYDTFRGKQEEVINNLLAQKDTFVIMPTGAGKSLCYQLPALVMEGTALVISPLIALMKNQVDQMQALGIEAGFLNSSMSRGEQDATKQKVMEGVMKLLYVAPESLVREEFVDFLKLCTISFVAVDEAHCISEWGHDFRPEYRRIREIINHLPHIPVITLTATATPKVRLDIVQNLRIEEANIFITSFNRPNLYYEIRYKINAIPEIITFIKGHMNKSGIIYCLSRRKVEEIAEVLNVNGIKAVPYHAGLDASTRSKHQDMFLNEDIHVVVATIAFGMGIDKPDVRFVIHYDVPKSIEGYYQETGRAGRDGLEGNCILFYDFNDILKLEKFMKDKSVSEREAGKLLLYEMVSFCESGTCRRRTMLHYFGETEELKEDPCRKMCDNCRSPKEMFDAQEAATFALQAVKQTDERTGVIHLINILLGTANQQVTIAEHDKLPVFGKGLGLLEEKAWKTLYNQLMVNNFLIKDIQDYGIIKLSDKGKEYLENPQPLQLYVHKNMDIGHHGDDGEYEDYTSHDEILFDKLKTLVRKVAAEKKVPPYVVFSEPSLIDMATKYPVSMQELQNISGVGQGKAAKFGAPFIKMIKDYVVENEIERTSDIVVRSTAKKSMIKLFILQHIDRRTPLDEIAEIKGITFDEVLENVEQIVHSGTKINIDYFIEELMDDETVDEIMDYFMAAQSESLEDAEKKLGMAYTMEFIRLVRIKFFSDYGN